MNPYQRFKSRKSHYQVIDGSQLKSVNCSFPHTAHCLANGQIMISTMGDKDENGKGDFVLIDSKTLEVTGKLMDHALQYKIILCSWQHTYSIENSYLLFISNISVELFRSCISQTFMYPIHNIQIYYYRTIIISINSSIINTWLS